jgi:hypothetical protein
MFLCAKTCLKQNKLVVILQTVGTLLADGNSLINKIITVITLDILLCSKYLVQSAFFFFMNTDNQKVSSSWNISTLTHAARIHEHKIHEHKKLKILFLYDYLKMARLGSLCSFSVTYLVVIFVA